MPSKPEDRWNLVVGADLKGNVREAAASLNKSTSQLAVELLTTERTVGDALQEGRARSEELARQNEEAVRLQESRIREQGYVSRFEQNAEDFYG